MKKIILSLVTILIIVTNSYAQGNVIKRDSIVVNNGYYIIEGSSKMFINNVGDTLSGDYVDNRGFEGYVYYNARSGYKLRGEYDSYWGFNGKCIELNINGDMYQGNFSKGKKEGLFTFTDNKGNIKKVYFHNNIKFKDEDEPGFVAFNQMSDFKKQLYYIDNGYFIKNLKGKQLKSGGPGERTQFSGNFIFNSGNLEFCNLSIITKNNYYSNDDCISLTSATEANNLVYLTFKGLIYLTEDHYSISSNLNSNFKIERHIKNEASTYVQKTIELQTEVDKNGHFLTYRVCFFDQEGHPDCGGSTLPYGGSFNKEIIIPEAPSFDNYTASLFLQNTFKIGNLEICKNDFSDGLNFEQAVKACNNLRNGWRLPNINELNILFQNRNKIGGFQDDFYWSSESNKNLVSIINFSNKEIEGTKSGHKSVITKNSTAYVRAVRVLSKNEAEDVQKKDNLKLVKKTYKIGNLEINPTVLPLLLNWKSSVEKCDELGNGWRLPTKEELNIMYKNQDIIGGFEDHSFWSSTEALNTDKENVWTQWFFKDFNGRQRVESKAEKNYFRAVRTINDSVKLPIVNKIIDSKKLLPIQSFNFEYLKVAISDLPYKLNWEDATNTCKEIGNGWRLPTKEEISLLHKYKEIVKGFKNENYWSSQQNEKNMGWFQDFGKDNLNNFTNKDYEFLVRLVKDNPDTSSWKSQVVGNPIKIGKFEVAQHDYPILLSFKDALNCIEKIKNGWRLPYKEELLIIYKNKNLIGGFNKDTQIYWSGSVNSSGQPILIYFRYSGPIEVIGENKDNYQGLIRLVRKLK